MTFKALVRSIAKACFYTANTIRYPIEMIRLREALDQLGDIDTLLDAGTGGGHYAAHLYSPQCQKLMGHVREGYTEPQLTGLFARHGMERLRTDWFMTKDTLRLGKIVMKCGGMFPKLFPLAEIRTTLEQRRGNGPYCILGLFRKTK